MRRAIAALAAFLALSGHTGSAFLAPPKGRPGGKSRAKKASPRKAGAKPGAAPKQFHLPTLPSLPSPQDLRDLPAELRERAEESWDARPRSPEEARVAALEALARVSEEIRVGQVLFGFTLSFALFSGALVTTSRILGEYLSSEGRGEVVQRALLYGDILDSIRESYVEDNVDVDQLFQTGVNAMLQSLDPYSAYENAQQSEDLTMRTVGRYGGVGLTIGTDKDDVVVLVALEGYAFDAGLRPGDRILRVDGEAVGGKKGLAVDGVKDRLRGAPGTKVTVVVAREGATADELSFELPRKQVQLRDVSLAAMMPNRVGYIKLDAFSEGTGEELARAIIRLQGAAATAAATAATLYDGGGANPAAATADAPAAGGVATPPAYANPGGGATTISPPPGGAATTVAAGGAPAGGTRAAEGGSKLKALVLDLRDNPGGLLEAAVAVAQQLVPTGTNIVSTAGRDGPELGGSLSYRSVTPPLLPSDVRLVLLINGNTASAAEIVSGAVQDMDRGVVVGQRSFGKGLVQVVEPLPGGAALKLTVAKYYTPSGRCIQAVSYRDKDAKKVASTGAKPVMVDKSGLLTPTPPTPTSTPTSTPAPAPALNTPVPAAGREESKGGEGGEGVFPADEEERRREQEEAEEEAFLQGGRRRASRRVPLAERKTFYTAAGRPVQDGGGIVPDVVSKPRKVGELERVLLEQGLFYRFAGSWLAAHPGDPTVQRQQLLLANSERAYQEFVQYVKKEGSEDPTLLESPRLAAQLNALQKSLDASRADDGMPREGDGAERPTLANGGVGGAEGGAGGGARGGGGSKEKGGAAGGGGETAATKQPTGTRLFPKASQEVFALREAIRKEQLAQFTSEASKGSIKEDVVESVLGRITAPSERQLSQLDSDPQVKAALALASDPVRYAQLLAPQPKPAAAAGGGRQLAAAGAVAGPAAAAAAPAVAPPAVDADKTV